MAPINVRTSLSASLVPWKRGVTASVVQ